MVGIFYMGLAAAAVVFVGSPLLVFQLMLETCAERTQNARLQLAPVSAG